LAVTVAGAEGAGAAAGVGHGDAVVAPTVALKVMAVAPPTVIREQPLEACEAARCRRLDWR